MEPPAADRAVGMLAYRLELRGCPGHVLRAREGDFRVREVLDARSLRLVRRSPGGCRYTLVRAWKRWGVDSIRLAREVASRLGLGLPSVKPLGLKDSRAEALQHIVVRGIVPRGATGVEVAGYLTDEARALLAFRNGFEVVVREVNHPDRLYAEVAETPIVIPNYYGYQRFGSPRLINHVVGRHIVTGDFKAAVMTFLAGEGFSEPEEHRKWRRELRESMDLARAAREAPPGLEYELSVIRRLERKPGDYAGALRALPLTLRRMFVEAFQSYIFNLVLSRRVQEGLPIDRAVEGDYICVGGRVERAPSPTRAPPLIPLVGYGYSPSRGRQGEIELEVLRELGITPRSFYVRGMEEVSLRGGFRQASQEVVHLSLEAGNRRVVFRMVLGSGCYATVLLREILRPEDPIAQGY